MDRFQIVLLILSEFEDINFYIPLLHRWFNIVSEKEVCEFINIKKRSVETIPKT